jgi:hypothetical protein
MSGDFLAALSAAEIMDIDLPPASVAWFDFIGTS